MIHSRSQGDDQPAPLQAMREIAIERHVLLVWTDDLKLVVSGGAVAGRVPAISISSRPLIV